MKLLLDTHAVLWSLSDPNRLSPTALALIQDPQNEIFVSVVSAWEMAIKASLGKLQAPANLEAYLEQQVKTRQMQWMPISVAHACAVQAMPRIHGDPFDRLLIAQAQLEQMPLLTTETALFGQYGIQVIW